MKRPIPDDNSRENKDKTFNQKMMKKKNVQRLGGRGGLSLDAFANAKTRSNNYNPALIKKQREFYKNAKYVSKYKKTLKQQSQHDDRHLATRQLKDVNETEDMKELNLEKKKNKKSARSLGELYEKTCEEVDKARIEREAIIQAKKEERERAESRRKIIKEKMFKKTKSGQPIMKYRIEHLLETIQGSTT